MISSLLALALFTTPVDQAKALYQAGGEAYRQGRYAVAIRAFEEVLRVARRPAVLFSAAQAYRLQYFVDGDLAKLERAVELYRAYLDEVPEGGRRDHAAQHLSTLTPILEQRRIEVSPGEAAADSAARLIVSSSIEGAIARVDGGEAVPIPAAFEVEPGERKVHVEAPEHLPQTVDTVAVAGSVVALNVDLEPAPGRLLVRGPEGARILLDGQFVGHSPLSAPIEVAPGRHHLVVTDRGRVPFVHPLELRRGQSAELDAELAVTGQRVAAWSLLGAGAALLAGAGATFALTLEREDEAAALEARFERRGLSTGEARRYRELEEERDELAALTIGLGTAAGAAVIAGVLLWVFDEADAPASTRWGPVAGPGGAGARVSW